MARARLEELCHLLSFPRHLNSLAPFRSRQKIKLFENLHTYRRRHEVATGVPSKYLILFQRFENSQGKVKKRSELTGMLDWIPVGPFQLGLLCDSVLKLCFQNSPL